MASVMVEERAKLSKTVVLLVLVLEMVEAIAALKRWWMVGLRMVVVLEGERETLFAERCISGDLGSGEDDGGPGGRLRRTSAHQRVRREPGA